MSVNFTDNSAQFLRELEQKIPKTLETIGQKAEGYAKKLCPVGTAESTGKKGYRGGTLRNSINFRVNAAGEEKTLEVGSNVEYAP